MRFYSIVILFLILGLQTNISAQDGYDKGGFVNHNSNLINGNYGIVARKIDMSEVRGDGLFWEEAMEGYVVFKNGNRTENYIINYDVLHDLLLFNLDADWLSVDASTIDSVVLDKKDEAFVMCRNRTKESEPVLMHLLCDGEFSLYKMKKAKVRKPTFNPALNTGNKFHEVKVRDVYVVCYNGKCVEMPKSVKKIVKSKKMPSKLKKYAKESGLKKLKKESDFVEFIDYINQIASSQIPEK